MIRLLIDRCLVQDLVALVEGSDSIMTMLGWTIAWCIIVRMRVDEKIGLGIPSMALLIRRWLNPLRFAWHSNRER